jgi:fermentation-respiration switch protein FrsA (DUF1100 family)
VPVLPVRWLLRDRFPLLERIGRVSVPTAVVLGDRDALVPPEQSRAVAAAAGGPVTVTVVAGAGHNDRSLLDGEQLVAAVVAVSTAACARA